MVHTPPGSNKSNAGCLNTETIEIKRERVSAGAHSSGASGANGSNNPNTTGIIRNEELSKMFPTPPSLEQHPNSSPCGASGNNMDMLMVDIMEHPPPNTNNSSIQNKTKQEIYPNFGSPQAEQIKVSRSKKIDFLLLLMPFNSRLFQDWTHVHVPPKVADFVSSSKYAPLTNLYSEMCPPITLPPNAFYKPSWVKQKEQEELQKQNESQETNAKSKTSASDESNKENQNCSNTIVKKEPNPDSQPGQSSTQPTQLSSQQSPMNRAGGPPPPSMNKTPMGPSSSGNNSIMSQILNSNSNLSNNIYNSNSCTPQHSPHPNMPNKNMMRPGVSPIPGVQSPYSNQFQQGFPGMINNRSPHPSDLFKKQQMLLNQQPPSNTYVQPPPPYEVAVHSPALGFQANNQRNMMNVNTMYNNQQQQQNQPNTATNTQNTQSNQVQQQRIPEASSLLVNILLYDTSLNIFRDHNFDSCTLCVCNAGPNCVGNIRGADSGIYLSLTSNCHFNENVLGVLENSQNQVEKSKSSEYSGSNYGAFDNNSMQDSNPILNKNKMMYQNSPASSASSASSPACMNGGQGSNCNQNNGYMDDDPISCRCGFSAVMNRRLAYQNGLFYEDEMEITGMAEDPAVFKKTTLMSIITKLEGSMKSLEISIKQESGEESKALIKANEELSSTTLPNQLMDLLREQCSIIRNSSNSFQRAIRNYYLKKPKPTLNKREFNLLEYVDAFDIISLAIEQSRLVYEKQQDSDYSNKLMLSTQKKRFSSNIKSISVHSWPYLYVDGPKSNQDIVRIMKSMQPLLQDAFHKKCTTRLWDAPYTVKGPLTWREFHRLAGRGTGQCEPQPIPSIIVGHDKDWLSVAPYALQYWDKLLLEPYSYPRDVAYIVVAPDSDFVCSRVKYFFKELSTTYEMCRLGRHMPVKGWDGILRVGKHNKNDQQLDEWMQALGRSKTGDLVRYYASALQQQLVPYLQKIPQDKSLLNPPEGYTSSSSSSHKDKISSLPSPMLPPNTPDNQNSASNSSTPGGMGMSCDKAPNTPKSSDQSE